MDIDHTHPLRPENHKQNEKCIVPSSSDLSTRRDVLRALGAVFLVGAIPWLESEAAEDIDAEHLERLKHEALEAQRPRIQKLLNIRDKGLLETLGPEEVRMLFEKLRKYLGCIDEGLVIPDMHKIGIAGVGAGAKETELDQFALFCREQPEVAREIERVLWHEHCAARESDDVAAEKGARELLRKLGLPESMLQSAGFSEAAAVKMHRDIHLHPGMSFVVDGTNFRCNGHRLGVPAFEIAARGVPMRYINRQVALTGKIISGKSGMASVMVDDDPIVGFIAHESPTEALHLEREINDALKEFPKKPEIIHVIHQPQNH